MKPIKNNLIDKANQLGFESYFGLMVSVNENCYHLWLADFQKWFRDNYNIFVEVDVDATTYPKFAYAIYRYIEPMWKNVLEPRICSDLFRKHDLALEAGLEQAIELIKDK